MTNPSAGLEQALQRQAADLSEAYTGVFRPEATARCVYDSAGRMQHAHLRELDAPPIPR